MDNPKKKLYNSLITSKDPDVKQHFSQWSEDEFDKKLSTDKKFQKDLFLDLKDIGLANDEATFTKDYLSAAPAAPAPAPTAAPAAAPAATPAEKPAASAKQKSSYGSFVIPNFGPLSAVMRGASGLVSTAKQMVGLKSEDQKYEEAKKKREAGSVSGFAGSDELGKIGLYETAASELREKQKQKAQAERPVMSRASFEGPGYIPPSGLSAEDKKAYEKSLQKYQKLFAEAIPVVEKQTQAAAQKAQNDPTAYKKDKYGKTMPDPLWVAKEARDIASKAGAPAGGYAENLIQSRIEAALQGSKYAPDILKEADRISIKKFGKPVSAVYSEDVYKNVEPVQVHQDRLKAAAKKVKQITDAEYKPKFDAVNNEYDSYIANYKASLANDPTIKQAVDQYDAKSIAALEKGVRDGVLSADEANAMLRSKNSLDARNTYINGVIDQKYGGELKAKYNKYLSGINVLNNRRTARLRRQFDELENYQNAQYQNQIEIAKKTYKISPERAKLLEDIQNEAYNNVVGKDMEDKRRYDMNASVWENFMSSSLKGLGEGIQSTAFTLGMEDVASFGNLLAKNFETSDLNINSWNDVGFGQEGITKFAMSAGNILGRMSPGLAASAGVAAATGGMGLGVLPSMLLAGVPSAAFETADIMGSVEQQMLSQSNGDIAKAQQAGSRALESQLKIWPTYLLDGLPFFPKILKFAGRSKYSGLNILSRGLAGGAINLVTETAQEVPQNVFEEIILADKDPTFSELYKNTTAEKIANTSASVVSMSLLMGSAPQIMDSSKDAIAKRAAAGYYAKQVLNEASHPGLMLGNQSQFITQLADQKDPRFAAQMVNILFQKGNIDKARAEVLATKLDNYERFKETELGKSKNQIVRQAGFILYDKYIEARNSKNKVAEEESLKALQKYASTGNAELVMLGTPDGSFNVYTYDDLNALMADEDFQAASREKNDKYGALFTVTPLIETQEGLQNPKLEEVLQRFEDIQKPSAEPVKPAETSKPQPIDDEKILEGQKRAGMEAPKLFDIIPVEAAAVVDAVRSGEEGITTEEISGASSIMYQIHKMYEKMRASTTRNLTIAQIDNITSDLEQAITDLENQKTRFAVGDEQMDLLQQQDTESTQTIDAATQTIETQQEGAPTETTPLTTETAPAETPAPAKPKAKINLFTDKDVEDSFTQKEKDLYLRLIFNGEETLANRLIQEKRRNLLAKEVELVEVGEISEKVRQSFASVGIDVELLSADEFVQKLKEAGESASRTQEGVFDDRRGKIFLNKDALTLGWGTTVIWHEAIHPIMNIIHNSNKPLYDKIHRGILANAKADPNGQMAKIINKVEELYTDGKGYSDVDRKDEIIVEVLARISAGTMSFNQLQPTLRQQFIDLINRIGRILGLNDAEESDMKAIKDLSKKITETIASGRDLSRIVGKENVGKFQRQESDRTQARAGAATSVKDIDVKEIRTLARPGNRVSKGLAIYTRDKQKIVEEAPDLSIEYVKEKAPDIFISNANIISKFSIVSGIKNFGNISTVEQAQEVYDIFIREVADNLKFLMDEFNPEFREISTLWYDGANILAQNLAKKYSISEEQAAAMIASLSPQKDWYQNVRLAEMVMMAFDENPDMTQKMVDKQKLINIEGQKKANQDIRKYKKQYETALADYSENPSKENRAALKKIKDKIKKQKDSLAKKIVAGKKLIEKLSSLVGQKMNSVPNNMKPYYARLWNEINTTKDYDVLRPDGVVIGPSYKNNGEKARVAWGSYSEIGKAVSVYLDGSQENITRTLGEMHKIRNFNNNIIDPMSQDNDVTMDTHAIAAALLMPLSGNSKMVKQNFGTGTSNSAPLGIKGLYYAYAEAYILAAKEVGLLPRQVQSITWEAVRGLFTDTYKNNKENVKKINDIWNNYLTGKLLIDETRRTILQEAGGINDPTWSGPIQAESGVDTKQGGVGRRGDGAGRVPVGRDTGRGGKRGSVAKSQASLGGRGQLVNIPLGASKKLENVASQNEDVITTKISVAPFYSVKIKTIEEANAILSSPAFIRYKKDIQEFAKAAGIKIKNIDEGIGGFAFDDGTAVKEATTVLEVTGNWQSIVDFAALSGALTPEVQESTIAGRYVEEKTKDHNADEYTFQINNTEAAFQAAIDAGFDTAGFTLLNDEIRFYNVFKYRIKNIKEKIDTFGAKYKEYGGTIKSKTKRPVQSEYIDYDDRAKSLGRIAADALQPGSNWAGLRDRIVFAEKRNQAFRDWKKVNKSEEADEYKDLRREQIEAGSQGEVLSDEKLERIKKLEKFFETPLTTVVSTDEERYEEAKAEIDAIADDVAKMVNGGFSSPFNIKRPARAAIKVVRWYSLNPNLLGDGSRTNIIVNTDTDADYLFEQIRDRFTIPGDRVEYDMPTPLGYPKRLVEIRTSNGKIAEIQVMTPQGYLAKDGVKYFPKDKQNLAREALGEIQERLGWKIPDGVGHYFYEIERDTNVQNNLRKEAVRVSNLYYEAFLNPDSTLSDSEFRKAISDFKNQIDNADKSKWDETNKGEAPESLLEYLGEKQQASLGGRQAAPSFSELDEVLDMSPIKSRAAREKLVEQYGKETVDKMIEISRNFEKIINDLEEQEVVKKDCP